MGAVGAGKGAVGAGKGAVGAGMVRDFVRDFVLDFVRDRLDGDIAKLRDFDFSVLRGDDLYGDTGAYGYSIERMAIVKAICSLAFSDAWPGLSYSGLERHEYGVGLLNTSDMILGCPLGDEFKGMTKFCPTEDQLRRAWAFYRLHNTIGNYVVWPVKGGSLIHLRDRVPRRYRYVDAYLAEIHKAFDGVKKMQMDVKATVSGIRKYIEPYQGSMGFAKMCDKLFLNDYIDFHGRSVILFNGVWSDQKDLTAEQYFSAFNAYLSFCEEVIPRRSELIIKRVREVL